jgi:fimbrial chaperone protein
MTKCIGAALFALLAGRAACSAQTLSVMPVNLSFPAGERAGKLLITNKGNRATSMQLRVYRWDQNGDNDALVPSEEVQVSPPITTIAPAATQLIRIVLRNTPTTRESAYRVVLDEIPPPPSDGEIHVVLRISIPLFAQPLSHAQPHLRFHVDHSGDDLLLMVDNDGGAHAKLRDVTLASDGGAQWKLESGLLPYVLAGATRTWRMTSAAGVADQTRLVVLRADSDFGPVRQSLQITEQP